MAIFPTFFFWGNRGHKNVFYEFLERKKGLSRLWKQKVQKVVKFTFFKRGYPMVLVQKWPYFQLFFFREYRPGKCLLRYSRTKKTPFQAIKTRSSKSRKIDISPKGLTHGFGPKMGIFVTFFFRQYRPGKCLFRYSKTKKRLCRL